MSDKLAFELVSPERLLASLETDMVVVPGEDGDFGVLIGHSPVLSNLRPGVISVYDGDRVSQQLFVEGGFAEVNEKGLIVLAEAAQEVGKIDLAAARQSLSNAEDDVRDLPADADDKARVRADKAVAIAIARIEAAEAA